MKKVGITFLLLSLLLTTATAFAQEPEVAYTYNPDTDERVPLYYEPSSDSKLFGEYFNGVSVNVLEHISDEWVKVQIVTWEGYEGVQMYMENKYLVYGEDGEKVEKTTIMYVTNIKDFYLHAVAHGQSTDHGPYELGESMELIGIIVPQHYYDEGRLIDRPLTLKEKTLHIKTGDISGFANSADLGCLRIAE